jgi:fucose permease
VAGAFIGTFLLTRISDRKYYLCHLILGLAVIAVMFAGVSEKIMLMVLIGCTGYAFSSIFSVLYSQALKHIPEKADEISGLMITGVFGGALVPPMMGVFSDMTGSQSGSLIVIAFFALYLLFCGIKIKKA